MSDPLRTVRDSGNSARIMARIACVLWVTALVAPPMVGTAFAAEQFPASPDHQGVVSFAPYAVFPQNRSGNGIYLNDTLILTEPGWTVLDVLPLPAPGRFVYLSRDAQEQRRLGVYTTTADRKARIREVTPGFYHMVTVLDGVVFKKMYRILEDKLVDLLPVSKTADGAVAGPAGVLFYHVASAVREDENGSSKSAFGLRLHLVLYDEERTRHLGYLIVNGLPKVETTWLDDTRIEIGLSDGRKQVLSVSQFQ